MLEVPMKVARAMRDRLIWAAADIARALGMQKAADWIETGGGPRPTK